MGDKSWKVFERNCSRDMGVERQPVTGERHGADNAPHPMFCFQFKKRASLPTWLWDWLGGIIQTAMRDNKVGVLVLKPPGTEDRDALAIVRWSDWVDLHGPQKFGEGAHRQTRRKRALDVETAPTLGVAARHKEPRARPAGLPRSIRGVYRRE